MVNSMILMDSYEKIEVNANIILADSITWTVILAAIISYTAIAIFLLRKQLFGRK